MQYILPTVTFYQITTPKTVIQITLNGKKKNPNPTPPKITEAEKKICVSYLDDIDIILNGGNRVVNHIGDYFQFLDNDEVSKRGLVKSSIENRLKDLKIDVKNLKILRPTGKDS